MMVNIIPLLIRIFFMFIANIDCNTNELIRLIGLGASIICNLIDAYQYQFCYIIHFLFNRTK